MRSKRVIRSLLLSWFLLAAVPVFGQLRWEARELSFKPEPTAQTVVADFAFTNSGDHPVTVTSLKTSCGCTTAKLEKKTYQPKEKGSITATFVVGTHEGLQTKKVIVETDDKAESTVLLTLRVQLPVALTVEPPALRWMKVRVGETKTITVRAGEGRQVRIDSLVSKEGFIAKWEEVKPGGEYRITVTPKQTGSTAKGRLEIHVQ